LRRAGQPRLNKPAIRTEQPAGVTVRRQAARTAHEDLPNTMQTGLPICAMVSVGERQATTSFDVADSRITPYLFVDRK